MQSQEGWRNILEDADERSPQGAGRPHLAASWGLPRGVTS
jgi:hypothetical protein